MATDKAPAFMFYPRDFLTDEKVIRMCNTEVGIYIRLLSYCWLEGSLPLETEALAVMVRMPLKQFTKVWEKSIVKTCFQVHDDGRLHQKRLDEERLKQATHNKRQSDNAHARWEKVRQASGTATAMPPHTTGNATALPAASPSQCSASAFAFASANNNKEDPKPLTPIKQRPIPGFPRLGLFPWMRDRFIETLGSVDFDLEGWLLSLEQDTRLVIPPESKERWAWLQRAFQHELTQRGLVTSGDSFDAELARIVAKGPSVRPVVR